MSIWHNANELPLENEKQIIFFAGGSKFPYLGWYNPTTEYISDWLFKRDIQKWAYTEDVLKASNLLTVVLKGLNKKGDTCI